MNKTLRILLENINVAIINESKDHAEITIDLCDAKAVKKFRKAYTKVQKLNNK